MDWIKANILTEDTLRESVDLTNEELRLNKRRTANRLDRLDKEARSVEEKLAHLYSAPESGKVDIDDLAPRLKELRAMQIELRTRGPKRWRKRMVAPVHASGLVRVGNQPFPVRDSTADPGNSLLSGYRNMVTN